MAYESGGSASSSLHPTTDMMNPSGFTTYSDTEVAGGSASSSDDRKVPSIVHLPVEPKQSKKEIMDAIADKMLVQMGEIFDRLCDVANPAAKQPEDMLRVLLIEWDNGMTAESVEQLLGRDIDADGARYPLSNLRTIVSNFERDHPGNKFVGLLRAEETKLSALITGKYPRRSIFSDIADAYARRKNRDAKRRLFDILLTKLRDLNGHHTKIKGSSFLANLPDVALRARYQGMFSCVLKSNSTLQKEMGVYAPRPKEKAAVRGKHDKETGHVTAKDTLTLDEIVIKGRAEFFQLHRATRTRLCGFAYFMDTPWAGQKPTAEQSEEFHYLLSGRMTYLKSRFAIKLKRDVVADRNYPRQRGNVLPNRDAEFANFNAADGRVPAGQCECGQWVYLLNPRFITTLERLQPGSGEAHRKEVMQLYNSSMMARYAAEGISVVYSCINRHCPNATQDIIDTQVIAEVAAHEAKVPFIGLRGLRQCTHPQCMTEWCGICGESRYHTDHPCPGPTKLAADLQELFDQGMVRICPSCKQPCYKESGECNSVTCKCTKSFCWRCGGDLNPLADHHHTCNDAVKGTEITDYGRYGFSDDRQANTKDPRNPGARSLTEAEAMMRAALGMPPIVEEDEETKEEHLIDTPEPTPPRVDPPPAPLVDRHPQPAAADGGAEPRRLFEPDIARDHAARAWQGGGFFVAGVPRRPDHDPRPPIFGAAARAQGPGEGIGFQARAQQYNVDFPPLGAEAMAAPGQEEDGAWPRVWRPLDDSDDSEYYADHYDSDGSSW